MHKLVIAEKPSVASTIANVLGVTDKKNGYYINQNYIVTSCFGHLVGLAMPEGYDSKYKDWNFETLPIIPEKWKFSVHKDGKERSLISAKVICAVSDPHKYETVKAVLKCEGADFSATGRTVIQDGWKATYSRIRSLLRANNADEEKVDTNINFSNVLSALSEGQVINSVKSRTSEHWTSPPKPYTEDTLLKAMETAGNKDYDENADVEKKGIGTPATRSLIIESLVKRQYIQRKKKQIFPTEKGIELVNVVPDEVKNAKMTADWETELQSVEKGLCSAQSFMQKIEDFTRNLCSSYGTVAENAVFEKKAENGGITGKCPKCGNEVKKGKFGYYCTGKCGMNLSKVYGKVLTDVQLQHLLEGKQITYTVKEKKTIVLPEVEENNYQGKTYYQWKVKK